MAAPSASRIVRRHEPARLAGDHFVRDAADGGGDNRQAMRHRLQHDERAALVPRRVDEERRAREGAVQRLVRQATEQFDVRRDPGAGDRLLHLRAGRAIADVQPAPSGGQLLLAEAERGGEHIQSLIRLDAREADDHRRPVARL